MHQIAIFGAGRIGSVHAANVAAHSRCSLAAIVDPDLDAANQLAGAMDSEMNALVKRAREETGISTESDILDRKAILVTAKGPTGTVGQPGNAVQELINKENPSLLIMIDAALKLEGEKTGEVAEGIDSAIGGIGVDKFKIEEAATNNNIPVYAIVVKQTVVEAISIMTKEIAESVDTVHDIIHRIIKERTQANDKIISINNFNNENYLKLSHGKKNHI